MARVLVYCICFFSSLACLWFRVHAEDLTLQEGASGAAVVQAVIAKLDSSEIFPSDHRLLRRIAYVENHDGTGRATQSLSSRGGIWAVEEAGFQELALAVELSTIRDGIRRVFLIDWALVTWNDLPKPFYSGLAARLFLSYLELSGTAGIPLAGDIQSQAQFWFREYHSGGGNLTIEQFVVEVNILDKIEGCRVNTDLFFVLDGSGSITSSNFDHVRTFEFDFVRNMEVGPNDNQIGTIMFSYTAQVVFYLNTYHNQSRMLNAIQNIDYPSGGTNTPDGLCKLIQYGFTEQNGARPPSASVFRVAVVMTDGRSNQESQECHWNTLQAAEALHKLTPPVLVFVIGVTSSVNQQELEAIASSPKYVTYLESFDSSILQEAQEEHIYAVCKTASVPADTGSEMNGTLDQDESIRYHFPIPVAGITIHLCVSSGHVVIYGSVTIPNPNSAFYDWMVEVDFGGATNETEICDNFYVNPDKIQTKTPPASSNSESHSPTTQATATSLSSPSNTDGLGTHTSAHLPLIPTPSVLPSGGGSADTAVVFTNLTVYIAVIGKQKDNDFALNSTVGDVYGEDEVATTTIIMHSTSTPAFIPETSTPTINATPNIESTTPAFIPETSTPTINATPNIENEAAPDDDQTLIFIAGGSAGVALLVFLVCVLIPCCVCAQLLRRRKKDYRRVSTTEDLHKLIPLNGDSV